MKKRVPAFVPQLMIRHIVGNFHVSTPDSEIEADIRRRLVDGATAHQVIACVVFALDCHHENQELYRKVTSGRFN